MANINSVPKITKKGFEAWLKQHKLRDCVGTGRHSDWCPIASYLGADGDTYATVHSKIYKVYVDGKFVTRRLSSWAQKFVNRVDKGGYGPVTAKRALKIFSEVTE